MLSLVAEDEVDVGVAQLNVKNTTLEQRMIANGVFGSLNEAWNAFKP